MSIGSKLKEARNKSGLSLEEISKKTKIRVRYLKALENDNYDIIPGEVYVKAFLKGYSNQVGLNGDAIVKEYLNMLEEQARKEREEALKEQEKNSSSFNLNIDKKVRNIIIVSLVGLLLIFVIIFNVFSNNSNHLPDTEAEQTMTQSADIDELEGIDNKPDINKNNEDTKQSSVEKQEKDVRLKEIELIARDRSWINIKIDGRSVYQGFIEKGETMKFSGEEEVELKIGNAAGITMKKDGVLLGPWGGKGEVILKEIKL
ncbi:helix-turn-helix domain-containing protein [Halothermothrix orenii]|uniref:Helix-turn-helix n=1 Tax=Halothermothrix orenii (strain H 168 / OCM 544 / DSM 9562) TaxID=373903 RepID=B8CWG9_HALOH|nr:helix-turn-helix domain-containing protein [Halothermothrix orenii]ACL69638.1 Helix-turn-helix [Halothermothrix orenii H 168]